jgi:hypothetical protein
MPIDKSTLETVADLPCEPWPNMAAEQRRVIRERVSAAQARIADALTYVMYPEVRQDLRAARSELEVVLMWCETSKKET